MTLRVKYAEAKAKEGGSPLFGASLDSGWTGTRYFHVAWSDHVEAIKQLVGYSFTAFKAGPPPGFVGDAPPAEHRVLRRELPEIYPAIPRCVCVSARVVAGLTWTGRVVYTQEGFTQLLRQPAAVAPGFPNKEIDPDPIGSTTWKANVFKQALIQADYAQKRYDVLSDDDIDASFRGDEFYRFVTKRTDRTSRYLQLPGLTLYHCIPFEKLPRVDNVGGDDDETIRPGDAPGDITEKNNRYNARYDLFRVNPNAIGMIEVEETLYYTQHQVSEDGVPWATLRDGIGKVNSVFWQGHAPGTLLCLPQRSTEKDMPGGTVQQIGLDVEHVFARFKPGHNKTLRFVKGVDESRSYYYVTSDSNIRGDVDPNTVGSGKTIYDAVDFHEFFKPWND